MNTAHCSIFWPNRLTELKLVAARYSPGQVTVFLLVLIAAFATRSPVLIAVYACLTTGLLATNLRTFSQMRHNETIAIALLVLAVTLMLPLSVWRSTTAMLHYAVTLLSLGTAVVLSRELAVYRKASGYSLVIVQLLVGVYIWRAGVDSYPLETIIPDSSSNGITEPRMPPRWLALTTAVLSS